MSDNMIVVFSILLIIYGTALIIAAKSEWDDVLDTRRRRPVKRYPLPPVPATAAQRADVDLDRSHKWDSRTRTWH